MRWAGAAGAAILVATVLGLGSAPPGLAQTRCAQPPREKGAFANDATIVTRRVSVATERRRTMWKACDRDTGRRITLAYDKSDAQFAEHTPQFVATGRWIALTLPGRVAVANPSQGRQASPVNGPDGIESLGPTGYVAGYRLRPTNPGHGRPNGDDLVLLAPDGGIRELDGRHPVAGPEIDRVRVGANKVTWRSNGTTKSRRLA